MTLHPTLLAIALSLGLSSLACNLNDSVKNNSNAPKDMTSTRDDMSAQVDLRELPDQATPDMAPRDMKMGTQDMPLPDMPAQEDMAPKDLGQPDMTPADMGPPPPIYLIAGSGSWGGFPPGRIVRYELNTTTNKLSNAKNTTVGRLPSFMAFDADNRRLHVGDEVDGKLRSFSVGATISLDELGQLDLGAKPVYISTAHQGKHVLAAYYGEGQADSLNIGPNGAATQRISRVNSGPKTHAIIPSPDERYAFATSLEDDKLLQYLLASDGTLTPNPTPFIQLPRGSGPRHITFHPNGRWLYLVNELKVSLIKYDYNATQGTLTPIQTTPLYPQSPPDRTTGADVHIHPSGRWLFATTRERNNPGRLAIAPLDAQGNIGAITLHETRGQTPRNMAISPDGRLIAIGNQDSNNVATFSFDERTGDLQFIERKDTLSPFFVDFIPGVAP